MERIVAITVTYNRTGTLFRCLQSLREQTIPVHKILVIDNNSGLREKENLRQYADKYDCIDVLWLSENTGGAGGFEAGIVMMQIGIGLWMMMHIHVPTA